VAIVEVNCETDFVAKDANFVDFTALVADAVITGKPDSVEALMATATGEGSTLEEARQNLVAKIGENIQVRRFQIMDVAGGTVGSYLHGARIGVIVDMKGGDADLAKDVAMHIAASKPACVSEKDVPPEMVEKEKEILIAQAESSGKPREIIEKMIEGRLRKYLAEITLVGQPFVKDPDTTVGKLLDNASAEVLDFTRFEVGEGIEKKTENFAEEVMAQVKASE
jgi:elongation factor Ts